MLNIGIIDYGAGNVFSVQNAVHSLGFKTHLCTRAEDVEKADKIIFPGVGSAGTAMKALKTTGLDQAIINCEKPVLGICLGMQLLFQFSDEDNTNCLSLINGRAVKFEENNALSVPHMGWNTLTFIDNASKLLKGLTTQDYFYFVHSYYLPRLDDKAIGVCSYGTPFTAVVEQDNFVGVQFHPEKSANAGLQLLNNFLSYYG